MRGTAPPASSTSRIPRLRVSVTATAQWQQMAGPGAMNFLRSGHVVEFLAPSLVYTAPQSTPQSGASRRLVASGMPVAFRHMDADLNARIVGHSALHSLLGVGTPGNRVGCTAQSGAFGPIPPKFGQQRFALGHRRDSVDRHRSRLVRSHPQIRSKHIKYKQHLPKPGRNVPGYDQHQPTHGHIDTMLVNTSRLGRSGPTPATTAPGWSTNPFLWCKTMQADTSIRAMLGHPRLFWGGVSNCTTSGIWWVSSVSPRRKPQTNSNHRTGRPGNVDVVEASKTVGADCNAVGAPPEVPNNPSTLPPCRPAALPAI